MDQIKANKIHAEFNALLKEFAKKHGLTTSLKGSFTSAGLKMTCQFADIEATGGQEFPPEYVAHCAKWGRVLAGLTVQMLGTEYEHTEYGTMVFSGTRGTTTKYLIMRQKSTGDHFRFPFNRPQANIMATAIKNTFMNKP